MLKFHVPVMLVQLIFGLDGAFGKLGLFPKEPRCLGLGIYNRPQILGLVLHTSSLPCICCLSSFKAGERLYRLMRLSCGKPGEKLRTVCIVVINIINYIAYVPYKCI